MILSATWSASRSSGSSGVPMFNLAWQRGHPPPQAHDAEGRSAAVVASGVGAWRVTARAAGGPQRRSLAGSAAQKQALPVSVSRQMCAAARRLIGSCTYFALHLGQPPPQEAMARRVAARAAGSLMASDREYLRTRPGRPRRSVTSCPGTPSRARRRPGQVCRCRKRFAQAWGECRGHLRSRSPSVG
jgi:hypothetical protein